MNQIGTFCQSCLIENNKTPANHLLLDPFQLSSLNSFLESINDYLKLKDEELALSISAQRVEGYELEGISEDVDRVKYVFLF